MFGLRKSTGCGCAVMMTVLSACAAESEEAFEGRLELIHADPAAEDEESWESTTWRLVDTSGRARVLDLAGHELGAWQHGATATVRGAAIDDVLFTAPELVSTEIAASASPLVSLETRRARTSRAYRTLLVNLNLEGIVPRMVAPVASFRAAIDELERQSNGRVSISLDAADVVEMTLPTPTGPESRWTCFGLPDAVRAELTRRGISVGSDVLLAIQAPRSAPGCRGVGGFAVNGSYVTFLADNRSSPPSASSRSGLRVWVHELGHYFGLPHARGLNCPSGVVDGSDATSTPRAQRCRLIEYGDKDSVMGSSSTRFSTRELELLGWLDEPERSYVDRSGTFTLFDREAVGRVRTLVYEADARSAGFSESRNLREVELELLGNTDPRIVVRRRRRGAASERLDATGTGAAGGEAFLREGQSIRLADGTLMRAVRVRADRARIQVQRGDACFEPPYPETCNGEDDDCDGVVDDGASEICNDRDDDCDGTVDEGDVCGRPSPRPTPDRDGDGSDGDQQRQEGDSR
jgi:hypothetical protein